jgi:hypothetical protein
VKVEFSEAVERVLADARAKLTVEPVGAMQHAAVSACLRAAARQRLGRGAPAIVNTVADAALVRLKKEKGWKA